MQQLEITTQHLIHSLRDLGLFPGMGVMVHSSLKSFGYVVGGPETVIRALMDIITPEGTLLFPSFNHNTIFEEGGPGVYDSRQTLTTNGAIPDYFWRLPGVVRSLDPTHAFAAWGRNARRYTQFHHRTLTMGPQSPLGLLQQDNGYGLLLGVDYFSNTFHHVVEMTTDVPCLGLRTEAYPVRLTDGRVVLGRTWGWRESSCPFTDEGRYQDEMAFHHRQAVIGSARVTLFKLADCFDVVAPILREGKAGFPPCSACSIRPRRTPFTVLSDWDVKTSQPSLESVAWEY